MDNIEWDLHSQLTPEEFAIQLCADLGLSGEALPLVAHAIHEELIKHKRDAIEWGVVGGDYETLNNADGVSNLSLLKDKTGLGLGWGRTPRDGRGPKTLRSVWRDWAEVEEFRSKFELLTADEVERREMERDRATRFVISMSTIFFLALADNWVQTVTERDIKVPNPGWTSEVPVKQSTTCINTSRCFTDANKRRQPCNLTLPCDINTCTGTTVATNYPSALVICISCCYLYGFRIAKSSGESGDALVPSRKKKQLANVPLQLRNGEGALFSKPTKHLCSAYSSHNLLRPLDSNGHLKFHSTRAFTSELLRKITKGLIEWSPRRKIDFRIKLFLTTHLPACNIEHDLVEVGGIDSR